MSRTARLSEPGPGDRAAPALDPTVVRRDFPALHQSVHGKPLVYLDSAATAQKPRAVIDAVRGFYEQDCANIHRGVHALSVRATEKYEAARLKLQTFLGAREAREIVFVRGATEAINLVAQSWARPRLRAGDEILLTELEHHSNIVPWQILCEQTGAKLAVVPIDDAGQVGMEEFARKIGPRTRIAALSHVSNALGTVNPVAEMVKLARAAGAVTLIDGAQAAPHLALDVQALGCDFYAVSGHKMYGPTGIGALYGRIERFMEMAPYQGGGDMIKAVSFTKTIYNDLPWKFEAGTPHIAGAIGLGAAVDYLQGLGLARVAAHEHELLRYAQQLLAGVGGLRFYGRAAHQAAVQSFTLAGVHPHDAGTILDQEGVAVRTGHHCAQPVMERYGIAATVRASFGLYNTREDVDRLVEALGKVTEIFGS